MSGPHNWPLSLFQGYGIELEHMIVDRDTLAVLPICDRLLARAAGGEPEMEIERGDVAWSNELALHVVEMKTNGPSDSLAPVAGRFQTSVGEINELLAEDNAMLLGSAMHPFMNSETELKLWPHENDVIYQTLHRIFDCRGHGWANLQSMHINLPFSDDEEFGRLHAAIRLALPLLPALAASSPFVDGKRAPSLDFRLETYRGNANRVPSVSGVVIPEPVFTPAQYERVILQGIYNDMATLDPDGVLRHEWINARGAIARFDRGAIEIRLIDAQECPAADLAIAEAVVALVRAHVEERWVSYDQQRDFSEERLALVLQDCVRDADYAVVDDDELLDAVGWPEKNRASAGEVWSHLIGDLLHDVPAPLQTILDHGPLARRLVTAVGAESPDDEVNPDRLREVYRLLADCLARGEQLAAGEP